MKFSQEEVRNS